MLRRLLLVFFRDYYSCVARLAGLDGFACGALCNEKVGEGSEVLISPATRGRVYKVMSTS